IHAPFGIISFTLSMEAFPDLKIRRIRCIFLFAKPKPQTRHIMNPRKNRVGFFLLKLQCRVLAAGTLQFLLLAPILKANAVTVDPSNRYYRNAIGNPVFLIGYYDWAAVPDGYFIDHPSRYATMIQKSAPYKLNYVRMSSCVNRFTSGTNPQSWNNQPT